MSNEPVPPLSEKEKFWKNMNAYLEKQMQERGVISPILHGPVVGPATKIVENYDELDAEGKKAVDALMDELKPDIDAKAKDLLYSEVRDKIVRSGDIKKLQEYVKKGQKGSIKRKKGCIFVQFGTGDPDDEIHEFNVAAT
jgi:hypothetical protein